MGADGHVAGVTESLGVGGKPTHLVIVSDCDCECDSNVRQRRNTQDEQSSSSKNN